MLLTGVFNWVVETSIMASILAILIIIIKYLFKNTLGSKWHYAIWGLLIIRLIIPIGIESSLSIYNVFHPTIIEDQKPLQLSSNYGVSNYTLKDSSKKNISQNNNTLARVQDNNKVQYENKSANGFYYRLMYILPTIWLAGALILFLFIISQGIVFYLTVKSEILLSDETILKLLNDCKAVLGIKRSIPIVKTNKIRTPCLFGVLTPKILIPESLLYEFDEEDLRCIFLHELSHYKRKDILVNWISVILQSINWFNPIIWYSFRKMREDCELACDDYVLRHLVEKEREQYGLSIINLLSISKSIWTPVTTGFFGNNKKQIIRRIKAIKVFKKSNIKWTVITAVLIICLGITVLTNPKINQTTSTNAKMQSSNSAKYGSSVTTASGVNNSEVEKNTVRAEGKSNYGMISIVPKTKEKIEQLGADSCYGVAADYSITGDYDVIYKADDGRETVITTLNNLTIIQPQNSIIELNRLIAGDTDIFYFIPEYSGSNNVEIRFFAITKQKKAFQFRIEDNKAREFGDINILSDSTGVLSTTSKTYVPPQLVGKENIVLTSVYNIGSGQDLRVYKVIFNADVKNKIFKYVSKKAVD